MNIKILYFASLREALQTSEEALELPADVTNVGQLRQLLVDRGSSWADSLAAERAVRVAVNQAVAEPDTAISEGAEVAFFPPVTGG
ncbi:MAG: molybdopterin converting factor subunit 1 [Burkholderiaceae bacterium]